MIRRTSFAGLTAAALAAVVFTAPATAQRQRETLSDRVERLERQLGSGTGAAVDDADARQTLANMMITITELQQEIRELRGLVEEQSFEIEQLRSSQREQYLDLDQRLSSGAPVQLGPDGLPVTRPMTPGMGQPAGQPVQAGPVPFDPGPSPSTQPVREIVSQERPEVRPPIEAQLQTTGLGADPNQDIQPVLDPAAEKDAYDAAFAALKEGRYAESARLFDAFVDRFPGGEYADNAQYWLGESYYVTGNYRIALDSFQQLIARFPQSNKTPDAKLKLGFTYYELKQWDAAENMLNEVLQQFPGTTVSRLAENRLRTMRIEGHIN
ncbi:MAG: tol-pal system protein YbgF [Xanthomonadales bacterium]|nr:tol-pal system protein YbgF [Xanthomonadales bacterium]